MSTEAGYVSVLPLAMRTQLHQYFLYRTSIVLPTETKVSQHTGQYTTTNPAQCETIVTGAAQPEREGQMATGVSCLSAGVH